MAASSLNSSHQAVIARYESVDSAYREQRDMRLLGFVLFLVSDVVIILGVYLRVSLPAQFGARLAADHEGRASAAALRRRVRGDQLVRSLRIGRDDARRHGELEAPQ